MTRPKVPSSPSQRLRPAAALLLGATLTAGGSLCALAQGRSSGVLVIAPSRRPDPNQMIGFSFQDADVDQILRFLAEVSGKTVYKDPGVSGSFTIRNQSQIRVAEAIKIFQNALSLRGFALVETPTTLEVTTANDARTRRSAKFGIGKDLASIPTGKEVINHLFPLESVDAVTLKTELAPLFPAGSGIIIANSDTNSLLVIDEADNVRRIAEILQQIDRSTDDITVEVIRLKVADATEVATYLTDLFRQDTPAQGGQPAPPIPGQQPGAATPQRGGLSQLRGRVRIAADQRSNSVLVYATKANIDTIKELISRIDVDVSSRSEYRIVALENADATALVDQLNELLDPGSTTPNRPTGFGFGFPFGGGGGNNNNRNQAISGDDLRAVADVRTNSVILTGPIDSIGGLEALVRKLDTKSQVQSVVRVFQLKNAIASETADTLRNLFQGNQQQGGGFALFGAGNRTQIPPNSPLDLLRQVTIVANDQTNQLLISGPKQTFEVIEELLRTDEGGLDKRLRQVFIEVIIADVTLDDQMKFGIEWNAMSGKSAFGQEFGLVGAAADSTGLRYSVISKNFQATLQALRDTNRLRIVSTPHVMVTDNSPALISIGENIPYAGQTTFTQGVAQTSVEFQDVAITLNVTPHISPGKNILMDIDQVVNSLIEFITVAPGQQAPRTTNRRAGTTVIVDDNQTVVLGGIISNDEQKQVQKIPILGDIPVFGQFFRNTLRRKSRTELVVFITPRIVEGTTDANDIRDYERQRLQVDPLKRLDAPFLKPLELKPEDVKRLRNKRQLPDK